MLCMESKGSDQTTCIITILHSERPKLYAILVFLSAVRLNAPFLHVVSDLVPFSNGMGYICNCIVKAQETSLQIVHGNDEFLCS